MNRSTYYKRKIINCLRHFNKYQIFSRKKSPNELAFVNWKKNGCILPPPPEVKQWIIASLQKKWQFNTLIETGTYLGQMIEAQSNNFQKIYSIELGDELHLQAKMKFAQFNHIELIQGDSSKVLGKVLDKLNTPAFFWLDGHYSEGITAKGELICPIYGELDAIFNSKRLNHLLVIDDERLFNGTDDYPNKNELLEYISLKNPGSKIESKYDMIIIELRW
jgi:hypothetical protein